MPAMTDAQQLLQAGIDAQKQQDHERAEDYLLAAFKQYPPGDGGRRTAAIFLGYIYRKTGRFEDAITSLERGLPFPGAFKELVSIHRFLGKAARKEGDKAGETEAFRRMYSLAMIQRTAMGLKLTDPPHGVDWDRGARWIDDIRAKCGTIYAYHFDGQEIEGDDLLSGADYKALRSTAQQV